MAVGSFPFEITAGDTLHAETVAAGIVDSCDQVVQIGTVGVMSAESAAAESLHDDAISAVEIVTVGSLPLEILAADAIHAETVAAGIVDTHTTNTGHLYS